MKKIIIVALLALAACNNTKEKEAKDLSKIKQMDFFLGKWEILSGDGIFVEKWDKFNDTVYTGNSYQIIGNDTTFSEKIVLMLRNNELYYIPTVSNQNTGEIVEFKLVSYKNNEFVFENKNHDFPQRIIYNKTTADSLKARIEGTINGNFTRQDFPMSKAK